MRCTVSDDELEGGGLWEAGAHDRDQCAPALAANALIGATRPASAAPNYVAKDCPVRTRSRHVVREISCLQNCDTQKISRLKTSCWVAVSIGIVIRFLLRGALVGDAVGRDIRRSAVRATLVERGRTVGREQYTLVHVHR